MNGGNWDKSKRSWFTGGPTQRNTDGDATYLVNMGDQTNRMLAAQREKLVRDYKIVILSAFIGPAKTVLEVCAKIILLVINQCIFNSVYILFVY